MPKILLIDNDLTWVAFATGNLGDTFQVEVAPDLDIALAKLEVERFDLIIASACHLQALEVVRDNHPNTRMIVATNQPSTREAIRTYRLGVLDYFAKDFQPNIVSEKIHEAIQKPSSV